METVLGLVLGLIAAGVIVLALIKLFQLFFDKPEHQEYHGPVILPPEVYPPERPEEKPEKPELDPNVSRIAPRATRGRIYEKKENPGHVVVPAKGKASLKVEKVWRKDTGEWEEPYARSRKDKKYSHKHKGAKN